MHTLALVVTLFVIAETASILVLLIAVRVAYTDGYVDGYAGCVRGNAWELYRRTGCNLKVFRKVLNK